MDDSSDSVRFRDVVIVGGGCYGSFYAGQLERARARGKAAYRRLLIVDRNPACQVARELGEDDTRQLVVQEWGDFFDAYLGGASPSPSGAPPDAIVPSPLMPHLMYEWLVRRARDRWPGRPSKRDLFQWGRARPMTRAAPDGTRYISFADWTCPTHCIEPAICPVIRAPRTWEMADAMEGLARRLSDAHPTAGPGALRLRAPGVWCRDVRCECRSGGRCSGSRVRAGRGHRWTCWSARCRAVTGRRACCIWGRRLLTVVNRLLERYCHPERSRRILKPIGSEVLSHSRAGSQDNSTPSQ